MERGVFAEVLSGELLREEDIGEAELLNEDITEYKGKVTLQMEPYSVKVIMSSSNSSKNNRRMFTMMKVKKNKNYWQFYSQP